MTGVDAGPLVALAALVGGILGANRVPHAASGALLVFGIALLGAALFARGRARVVVAAIALAAIGGAVMARATDGREHSPFGARIAREDVVVLTGVVVDDPSGPSYAASALVRVRVGGTHRMVLATANGDDAERFRLLEAGDHVTLRGRLAALGTSNFEQLARWRHAVGRLDTVTVEAFTPPRGLFAVANVVRDEIIRGTRPLASTPRALTAGFLLGDTRAIPPDVTAAYRDSGLSHLLAVSGENVAFMLALFAPLLRRLPLAPRTLLALAVVVVFATMTRFEPSVLRASAMASIALLATFAGRPVARVRLLALAVIALLIVDPFLLHSVAFLLSCGASAGIALAEPAIASRLRGPRVVREPLAVSLAAQIGVTPVLLLAFGSVPVVTPLANLLAAPAAELVGVYGMLASAVAGVVPRLGPFLQQPTAFLVGWVTLVARAGAAVPVHLNGRGALACIAIVAATASLRCLRARRSVPDIAPR
jgi:competence protein ComEC